MTRLEEQLLAAFDELSSAHAKQHADSAAAGRDLREMCERVSKENAELRAQVHALSEQVERLGVLLTPSSPSGPRGGRPPRR